MEDILASIKKVIAEEKELRASVRPAQPSEDEQLAQDIGEAEEDVLELNEPLAPPADLGPPLIDEHVAGQSRHALEQLQTVAASVPAAPLANPLEDMDAAAHAQGMARRASAPHGRGPRQARDHADHRSPAVTFARGRGFATRAA